MNNGGNTYQAVVKVLYDIQAFSGRPYSWMSRAEIVRRLDKFQGVKIALSTLDYHLKNVAKNGLFVFYPRNAGRNPNGTIFVRPSNRSVTIKGLNWLKRKGILISKKLMDHLKNINKIPRGRGPDFNYKNGSVNEKTEAPGGRLRNMLNAVGRAFISL